MADNGLGRVEPKTWLHVEKYGVSPPTVATVESALVVPKEVRGAAYWQGSTSQCVGASGGQHKTFWEAKNGGPQVLFDFDWLWCQACQIDSWGDNNDCADKSHGTAVRSAFDIMRTKGLLRAGGARPSKRWSIGRNEWVTSVDAMRALLAQGTPVNLGTTWYSQMFRPEHRPNGEWVMSVTTGNVVGGHSYIAWQASDQRQAFLIYNTWENWPAAGNPGCWIPYELVSRLLRENGEAGYIVADEPGKLGISSDVL